MSSTCISSAGARWCSTFLDRETKAPLPNLEFQFSSSIEIERTRGKVSISLARVRSTGRMRRARPLLHGCAAPRLRQRHGRFHATRAGRRDEGRRDSRACASSTSPTGAPWFKGQQPARIEQTILVSVPLGEACASGQVPAWAIALAGGCGCGPSARSRDDQRDSARARHAVPPAAGRTRPSSSCAANAPATLCRLAREDRQPRAHLGRDRARLRAARRAGSDHVPRAAGQEGDAALRARARARRAAGLDASARRPAGVDPSR